MAITLEPTIDPADAGFDKARLTRIDDLTHRYVDSGRFPYAQTLVTRYGEIVHHDVYGTIREDGTPARWDTVQRIYSMTKPVTSLGLMQLYEKGLFLLEDPVSAYLPAFAGQQVWADGDESDFRTVAPDRPMTVKDLFCHTSGLTYGFHWVHPLDALYRERGLGDFSPPRSDLASTCDQLAELPLLFSPGTRWNYSMSTDVLGRLIEVIDGRSLDVYLRDEVFEPLGMVDTGFHLATPDQHDRFASLWAHTADNPMALLDPAATSAYAKPPLLLSGGGGLVSTMADYHRFTQCLRLGGELDGARIIGPRTLAYMTHNHLPGGRTLNEMGQTGFAESAMEGVGFGLGFSTIVDPADHSSIASVGDYGWGGAASTVFAIDPIEDLTVIFMTQLLPSSTYPVRRQLRAVVQQALVD
jgi:CubicO group peptidase (beta-lactamase class C family)